MSVFVVDQEKCKRCWACVAECPTRIIEIKPPNPIPTLVEGGDESCITCGHCVVVCPHAALSHRAMMAVDCPPMRKDWAPEPEYIEHYMRARRSIRAYKEDNVERDVLAKLIDIARFAPTGSNGQPVKWLVIQDSDEVHRIAEHVIDWMKHVRAEKPSATYVDGIVAAWETGVDYICRGAPHLIIAHSSRRGPTDCVIALTYMELAAPAFGLGTCWAGFVNAAANAWPPLQEYLGLPEGNTSHGGLLMGYPKYKYHRLPLRNEAEITWR